jgi:RES domain-containing protein
VDLGADHATVPRRTSRSHQVFYRHAAVNRDAFAGGIGGRWGRAFPVIYLGRPQDSVTIEAYRHLVEETGIRPESVRPRTLYTVEVAVGRILDLTAEDHLTAVGLSPADLTSAIDDYQACQDVAAAAHQLEFHGVLAPAATGLGQTLAIFRERVRPEEMPVVTAQTTWHGLPADPRTLRVAPSARSASP